MDPQHTDAEQRLRELLDNHAALNDLATVHGLSRLIDKLVPLLQSDRLHNVVDALSALSDVVDLADDALIQKLTRNFEVFSAAAFNTTNTLNYAVDQAAANGTPPSLWQLFRQLGRDEDVRRGMVVGLSILSLLGRQARYSAMDMPED